MSADPGELEGNIQKEMGGKGGGKQEAGGGLRVFCC